MNRITKVEAKKAILDYLVRVVESADEFNSSGQIILNFDCLPIEDCDETTFEDLVRRVAR